MKPWEFIIAAPEDLPIFADVLADWQHPGERVVRWMAASQRWPQRFRANSNWSWRASEDFIHYTLADYIREPGLHAAPLRCVVPATVLLTGRGRSYHHTVTEAVWALINAVLASGVEVPEP